MSDEHKQTGKDLSEQIAATRWGWLHIERNLQDDKWGEQNHTDEKWLAIIMEEVGEAAKSMLESDGHLRSEVGQIAAVSVAWVECMERRVWPPRKNV